ncbi:MAG: hypothetical protein OXG78_02305 [Chloroflexi bacterium]|nr:hypothetical protein [Chloroflexota bacterium]
MRPRHLLSRNLWRGVMVIAGLAILLWSGLEDRDATRAAALGLLTAAALTMMLMSRRMRNHNVVLSATLAGALIGASASAVTAALMLFKDLRHAHPFPDFPPSMILGMLERLPPWTLAGALAGFGIALLLNLLRDRHSKRG